MSKKNGDKIIPISNQDLVESLAENNPALLSALLQEAEKQIQEETKGTFIQPERRAEFLRTIDELQKLLTPLGGNVEVWTDAERKALRHYIDVSIPDETAFDSEEFQKLLQLLREFTWCNFRIETEDEMIVLNLSFEGIWK